LGRGWSECGCGTDLYMPDANGFLQKIGCMFAWEGGRDRALSGLTINSAVYVPGLQDERAVKGQPFAWAGLA